MKRRIWLVVLAVLFTVSCLAVNCYSADETKSVAAPKTGAVEKKLVDNFEVSGMKNLIGGNANVYVRAPSRVMTTRKRDEINGAATQVLAIKYDKKNEGGPYGTGGWCGYYTLLKTGANYFDAAGYKAITFWVKGEKGDENFMIGLSDEQWDKIGDSVKSEAVGAYLKDGKITTSWQKATVPLETFFLDHTKLASITICFEGDCFPDGAGQGVVYIDDIMLE